LSLLTRKFSRFLKGRNQNETQQRKRYSKSNESNSSSYTCFGCGKPGHIKIDCPNNQNKENQPTRRVKKAKEKEHIFLGRKMKSPQQVTPQLELKKQICVSW